MSRGRASIPQHVRVTLGENIRRERVLRKMTQLELGEQIGTSQMMISRFEKGKDAPSVWRCYQIAQFFGTTVELLLKGTEPHGQHIRSEEAIALENQLMEARRLHAPRGEAIVSFMEPPVRHTSNEEAIEFGNWLKESMDRHNMTSDKVAEIVGCSAGYIRYVENGRGMPGDKIREALIALFDDTSDSITETKSNNPS